MSDVNMWEIEQTYYDRGIRLICGVDEAGRGPLAGPVCAAAVILPPNVGMMLAYTGAVKENVIDNEELAYHLMELLWKYYPDTVRQRYKVDMPDGAPGYELLEEAGRKRGFLMARGEINTERMAKVLLDEYRSGKLGHFTLEMPEESV